MGDFGYRSQDFLGVGLGGCGLLRVKDAVRSHGMGEGVTRAVHRYPVPAPLRIPSRKIPVHTRFDF